MRAAIFDLALFDVAMAAMVNQAQSALVTGRAPERLGSGHPNLVPYQAFEARDEPLVIAVGNDAQFARLCGVLGVSELAEDIRFETNAGRVEHRAELTSRLQASLRTRSRSEWLERLRAAGVPATPVLTLPEALADPQTEAREMVVEVDHPTLGPVAHGGQPVRLDSTSGDCPAASGPAHPRGSGGHVGPVPGLISRVSRAKVRSFPIP